MSPAYGRSERVNHVLPPPIMAAISDAFSFTPVYGNFTPVWVAPPPTASTAAPTAMGIGTAARGLATAEVKPSVEL